MTNLRELVAEAIYHADNRGAFHHYHQGNAESVQRYEAQSDAVLAALAEAGALMPEMPEDVKQVYLNRRIDGSWRASTSSTTDNRHYADKIKLIGTGATIPAAIANALEGAAK